MSETTNYTYVKSEEPKDVLMTEELLNGIATHPLYQPFVDMVDEAVNKDYEGGVVFSNCFPQEWNNVQVGFMIYSIQQSYPQVVSAEFYGENGMYIFLKNKKTFQTKPGVPLLPKLKRT